ncbi:Rab family GTPase [Entamoeba histolytica HM-1:IMSS-B]|uniref:Rab family GTPase n=7 Tax=Entamoeba histolytica TaxID=5759 RepID=C4M5L8_ENTH1|nr:Rab family GTPase [Entamoeba histolytica HM-1:IMSS]EMD42563.1 small GTPase EhRabF4, putative [Entamoeba histolytica KU27]EMH77884.1 Rab family GTPase [Entamoeba histolytica HM-1:IMSS-B]ENY63545.1 Rab family GTPase, putative [Entamoeba histolytica HM-1:IMSS-A]GAT96740.1 Rab family GTPase [Entamoeba histolytica]EAL48831.2 Rab family GTPase [Entamoeba histolytica HM-1:IMSS]|eukprot:XP_654217.2 Rab family GTPase [Entamoeba histolytica HM-1:IMSS]
MNLNIYKICLVGDQSVGKTSLVNRYAKGGFSTNEKATIGANFIATSYIKQGQEIKLALWDTAGQEKYRSMVSMYYRGSRGAVIVYDVTNRTTFEDIRGWYDEIFKAEPDVVCMLVGNKADNNQERLVSSEEGEELAKELGILFSEASAKTGDNVKETFIQLFEAINFDESHLPKGDIQLNKSKQEEKGCC